MTKIFIDARMVGPVLHGVARYVSLLASGLVTLRAETPLSYEPVFVTSPGFRDQCPTSPINTFETVAARSAFLSPRELWELPRLLRRHDATLYHSPTFSSLILCPCPWLVTVHDLNHLHFGGPFHKLYYRAILKPFVRKAEAVLTVSEFSRNEIAAWSGLKPADIEVAFNALDPKLAEPPAAAEVEAVLAKYGLTRGNYFFCLSNAKPHKNVPLLVSAYQAFRRQRNGAHAPAWPLVLSMTEFQGDGIIGIGGLREPEARALLAGAAALFFPSTYEGFGLPPAEAALLGTPVVVSRIPPHAEGLSQLGAGEALWVDPTDFHGWVNAFHRVNRREAAVSSPESRRKLAECFNPNRLGRHMDQVYRRVLGDVL